MRAVGQRWAEVLVLAATLVACTAGDGGESADPRTGAAAGEPPVVEAVVTEPAVEPEEELGDEWGTQPLSSDHEPGGVVTITEARIADNQGFDRIVIEMGDDLPSWEVRYLEEAYQCGSGFLVEGVANPLAIRITPARAHDFEGNVTVEDRDQYPGLGSITRALIVCDFEGQVEWVLSIPTPRPFRVMELHEPARLVVDVRH